MRSMLVDEIKNVLRAELKTPLIKALVKRVLIDSRGVQDGDLFLAIRGENFDGHDFIDEAITNGAKVVVIDRNMPLSTNTKDCSVTVLKVADTVKALGDLARFYRQKLVSSVQVVGITGTNGKTTVREMIYHVMSKYKKGHRSPKSFNNNIGVPLTIFGIELDHDFAVVEIGSNAPGEVAHLARMANLDVAVITHVGPSHLQGFKNIDAVSLEKVSILAGLKERGAIICGAEHTPTMEKIKSLRPNMITYGLDNSCDVYAINLCRENNGYRFTTNDRCEVVLSIPGLHNVKNALAALTVVRRLGISSSEFAQAIKDFKPMPGRMVYKQVNNITIIDDTYNANPISANAALEELLSNNNASRRVFICGDMCELGDDAVDYHQQLGKKVAASDIDLLLVVGQLSTHTARSALDKGMSRGHVQHSINSKRLARLVKTLIRDGDVIMVKGSRSMAMEKVVVSLQRWKGTKNKKTK